MLKHSTLFSVLLIKWSVCFGIFEKLCKCLFRATMVVMDTWSCNKKLRYYPKEFLTVLKYPCSVISWSRSLVNIQIQVGARRRTNWCPICHQHRKQNGSAKSEINSCPRKVSQHPQWQHVSTAGEPESGEQIRTTGHSCHPSCERLRTLGHMALSFIFSGCQSTSRCPEMMQQIN